MVGYQWEGRPPCRPIFACLAGVKKSVRRVWIHNLTESSAEKRMLVALWFARSLSANECGPMMSTASLEIRDALKLNAQPSL
jgi:hypothetical protein